MFTFTILAIIVLAILVFDKIRTMKSEIEMQRNFIFTMRDKIEKLEKTTQQLMEQLSQKKFDDTHGQQSKAMEVIEEEVVHQEQRIDEKVVAFSTSDKIIIDQAPLEMEDAPASPEMIISVSDEKSSVASIFENHDLEETDKKVSLLQSLASEVSGEEKVTTPKPPIDFDVKKQEKKKPLFEFNSENWVGVNLLNRLGALLIVIGAIATAAFDGFPSWVRTIILFAFAISVIVLGEVMNRKKPTTASMGVTAVGVALLYVAVAASYFVLGTLGMYSALMACVVATALGIYLAIRYDEQVVACFALVGGYLPIFALDPFNDALTFGLVVYFVLLATYSLALALSKKWVVSNAIGLFLAIISTTYLGFRAAPLIALMYACFAFLVYTVLPLVSAYRTDKKFHEADVILVIINAFVSSIIVFSIATRLDLPYVHTYLSVIFAFAYIGLAQLIKRVFAHKGMETIFTLKAVAFCFLFVPFTFDYRWFAVAWLIEAVVLMSYGILRKQKRHEYGGLSILGIAILTFLVNSVSLNTQFVLDYTFFSVGVLVILGMYVFEGRQFSGFGRVFKWLALGNLWWFTMYLIDEFIVTRPANGYAWALFVVTSLILVIVYVKLKWIADKGTWIIANVIHGMVIPLVWQSNFELTESFVRLDGISTTTVYWGVVFLNLSLILIAAAMIAYFRKAILKNKWVTAYLNIWLICFGAGVIFLADLVMWHASWFNFDFHLSVQVMIILVLSVIYLKLKVLTSRSLHIIVNIFHGISVLLLWISNATFATWWRDDFNAGGLLLNLLIMLTSIVGVVYCEWSLKSTKKWLSIYKNIMLVNGWGSLLFILGRLMSGFEGAQLVLVIVTFVLAFALKFMPVLYDGGTKIITVGMQVIGLVWLAMFNLSLYESMFVLLSLNAVAQLFALFTLNELIKYLQNKEGQETPFKVLILSGYFLLVVTQGVMVQGQVAFNSAIISVLFGVTALVWIVLGFYLKNQQIRKFGLYLAMLSAVKLLVVDTWGLSTPMRIGSYLTLGVVLMVISFVYQKFNIVEDE